MNLNLVLGILMIAVPVEAVLYYLLSFGYIGPAWWKITMRRYQIWKNRDASPLLPFDPYKPIEDVISGKSDNPTPPPLKQRTKNDFIITRPGVTLFCIGLLMGIIDVLIFIYL